jgi:hypothetical protein
MGTSVIAGAGRGVATTGGAVEFGRTSLDRVEMAVPTQIGQSASRPAGE